MSHPAEMPGEVPFGQELRAHGLRQGRRMYVAQSSRANKSVDQRPRNNEVPQAQRREKYFAESSEINNPLLAVESLKSRQWPARVAKLTVVVIFQDPRIGTIRPVEQSQSTRHTHRDAERVLVRGSDVRETGPVPFFCDAREVHPLFINGHGYQAHACCQKSSSRPSVTWIFNPCRVSRIKEHSRRQLQALL